MMYLVNLHEMAEYIGPGWVTSSIIGAWNLLSAALLAEWNSVIGQEALRFCLC